VLAQHAREHRLQLPPPRLIYTDSELLTADTRRVLQETFGTEPLDIFGTFETDNIAWQCERRESHHVAIDCAVVEVLDPQGRSLEAGEGDLVVSVLGNEAMPFIRYDLRDRAAWCAGDCACGRTLPRLTVAGGRSDDLLRVAGQPRSPMRLLAQFDSLGHAIHEYQLRQVTEDELEIHVVPGSRYDDSVGAGLCARIGQECAPLRVTLVLEQHIARTAAGKLKAFESRLPGLHR
jgi:phenylacetate-CoA ligase